MDFEYDARNAGSTDFADALRDAINAKGVTLSWLRDRLEARGNRVAMATLSYWRSGARSPEGVQSIAALSDIESLLDLEHGALTKLLTPTKRTGPLGAPRFPFDEEQTEAAVREAFATFGVPYPDTSREITTHSVTEVGADGYVVSTVTRSIIQSTVGTITAIPFLVVDESPDSPRTEVTAISGGRITQRYAHPSGIVHGGLFELDAPLTAPDSTVVEWEYRVPPGSPSVRDTGHALERKCRELLIWTRFHPDALPVWIEEHIDTADGLQIVPLKLTGRSVHQVHRGFGPGSIGLHWGYEARD